MITKEQLNLLRVFREDIFSSFTFKQIKEQSKQKSNNIIQIALKEFKKQNLLENKITGNVTTYSLNLKHNLTLSYLNVINETEINRIKFPKEILLEIQKRIIRKTEFFILMVFGSYAKNKATEKSDLDIAIMVESELTKKEITPFLETIKRREIISIDYNIFTRSEFLEMLKSDMENIGKQIYKNNLICYGYIEYCQLIRGIKNER
ncbi:MAG: nucleotidyltransferase domain-containing protein [Candidatus Woesearchaeota archaeon]